MFQIRTFEVQYISGWPSTFQAHGAKNSVTMYAKTAKRILKMISDDIQYHIKPPLPTYLLGNQQERFPPYLEHLIDSLPPPLCGKESTV